MAWCLIGEKQWLLVHGRLYVSRLRWVITNLALKIVFSIRGGHTITSLQLWKQASILSLVDQSRDLTWAIKLPGWFIYIKLERILILVRCSFLLKWISRKCFTPVSLFSISYIQIGMYFAYFSCLRSVNRLYSSDTLFFSKPVLLYLAPANHTIRDVNTKTTD